MGLGLEDWVLRLGYRFKLKLRLGLRRGLWVGIGIGVGLLRVGFGVVGEVGVGIRVMVGVEDQ